MKKIEIFCNYGVLAAEKRNVYTYGAKHRDAICADRMTVIIPEEWKTYEGPYGNLLIEAPWGWTYEINELLTDRKGYPVFYALDDRKRPYVSYLYTEEQLEEKRMQKEKEEIKNEGV